MHKFIYFPLIAILLSSCSFSIQNSDVAYLNYKYVLTNAGDIHGLPATSNEVLSRNTGYTNYLKYFDKENSYINFQCRGNSIETFVCETTFCLRDKSGKIIFGGDDFCFNTKYSGGQLGKIIITDNEISELVGTIYVYTPYWCRWQFNYDLNGDGNKILLTFEFWKRTFNEVPEWKINE